MVKRTFLSELSVLDEYSMSYIKLPAKNANKRLTSVWTETASSGSNRKVIYYSTSRRGFVGFEAPRRIRRKYLIEQRPLAIWVEFLMHTSLMRKLSKECCKCFALKRTQLKYDLSYDFNPFSCFCFTKKNVSYTFDHCRQI